jgi:DNA-binding response OmpR family regulator
LQLRPALRAIVLSGRVDQQARNRSREVGACAFLSKPCSLSDLRATIERVLFGDVQDGISTAQA